jgi:hypothetical protein
MRCAMRPELDPASSPQCLGVPADARTHVNVRVSLVLAALLVLWLYEGRIWLFAAVSFCLWIVGCHFEAWLWRKAHASAAEGH